MNLWKDIRFGVRTLRKAPGFAITAILTLALGIGATTAIFSVCDAMLWKPAPLPHLESLVMVLQTAPADPNEWNDLPPADVADIRQQAGSLENIASYQRSMANVVTAGGEPQRVEQAMVTSNFFDVLGVQPARGRAFLPGEDQPGREREAILSDGLWQRRFGSDPNIVGKSIRLDDQDFVVTGVMPKKFNFPLANQLWTPLALTVAQRDSRTNQILESVARLKPGRGVRNLVAELDGIARRLEQAYPKTNKNRRFLAQPVQAFLVGPENHQYALLLLGAVIFVLLIACVNIANLQFARASGRLREVAVRTALGAGRGRVILQLVTESLLLALAGAGFGLLIARWGVNMIKSGMPADIEKYILGWQDMHVDTRTLLFALAAAVVSGLVSGLAPAWQCSRPNLTSELKEGGRGSSVGRGRHRLRAILVASEIAVAVVLLVGGSLMIRGFSALVSGSAKMEPATLLTLRLAITESKYKENHQVAEFYHEVLERTGALPGVRSVVAVSALPYSQHSSNRYFTIEGKQVEPGNQSFCQNQAASPKYFQTLHIPLIEGRLLSDSDGADSPKVAVISQHLARRWFPLDSSGEPHPIGKRIKFGLADSKNPWITIVGVVADAPHSAFDSGPRAALYVPYTQALERFMDIGVRTAGDPMRLAPAVIAAIRTVDVEEPVTDVHTLETSMRQDAIGLNYMAVLMGIFGALALALSSIGVYGVMAQLVAEQTHDIGIRVALGAQRGSVLGMVFRRGMLTAVAGLLAGLPMAYGFARLLSSLVHGVAATDAVTFAGIPLALLMTAAVAIYIPAMRAMRIDPIVALRYE